ncbi:LOW QUALITY PROTEIN: brachyurin [Drosophila montana]|uniref:LOW QUALITY PROTEIN: brachyurin n=1 Tax=Drosophila montana TaxID=40370 RepID=UPI00313D0E77
MLYPHAWQLCLAVLGLAQAWSTKHDASPDREEELMSIRWQLGYERWQRLCEKYKLPEEQQEQPAVSTRIARGELAEPGMFPYQAGLLLRLRQGDGRQCGGSLISLEFVLTAAHCLLDAESAGVYLGSNTYADAAVAGQVFEVQQPNFKVYPGYPGFGVIALALDFMQPPLLEGQLVSTSGWGALGDDDELNNQSPFEGESNLLHYVDVPVLEQELCICNFLPGLVSTRRHICTDGRNGRGSCQGDSGGPLVYLWRNISYLIGVTAFGSTTGCELGAPTVYTRVAAYLDWIAGETAMGVGVASEQSSSQQSTKCN